MKSNTWVALILAAAVLAASSLACCGSVIDLPSFLPSRTVRGSGNLTEETRAARDFDRVALSGIGTLTIEQGEEEGLRIEAEDNLMPYVETEVVGRQLTIGIQPRANLRPTKPIRYSLSVRDLERIEVSGSGDVRAADLQASDLTIVISGAGDADLPGLSADRLTVRLSGAGDLTVTGQVDDQVVHIDGAGTYTARDLASQVAEVDVSGSGSATVRVSERLETTVSGSGSVRYIGDPVVEESVSGAGSVRQIGE